MVKGGISFGHLLKLRLYPVQLCPVNRKMGEGYVKTNDPKGKRKRGKKPKPRQKKKKR